MEQNIKNKTGLDKTIFWMLKSLLCSYVVTGILLLILAGILYKFNLDEAKVTAGILIIYVLSAFAGGFVIGKITGTKKFFWGLLVGIFYAVLLVLVSFGLYRSCLLYTSVDAFIPANRKNCREAAICWQ